MDNATTSIRFRRNAGLDATTFASSDGCGGLIYREPAHMSPRLYYVRSDSLIGCEYATFETLRKAKDSVSLAIKGNGELFTTDYSRSSRF